MLQREREAEEPLETEEREIGSKYQITVMTSSHIKYKIFIEKKGVGLLYFPSLYGELN